MNYVLPEILPPEYQAIPIVNMIGKLPVNPRVGNWDKMKGLRKLEALNTIVLHHDGMSKASLANYSDEQLMINIANGHIRSTKNTPNGDNFPYHIFIRNGIIYLTNPILFFTFGVASNNGYTVHIAVSGDYAKYDVLTEQDKQALILATLIVKNTMTQFKAIKGHKELQATSCPGYSVPSIVNGLRALEHHIDIMQTPKDQSDRAYNIANQILYLYNMFAKGTLAGGGQATEGERKWALEQVLKLEPEMKKHKLIK